MVFKIRLVEYISFVNIVKEILDVRKFIKFLINKIFIFFSCLIVGVSIEK